MRHVLLLILAGMGFLLCLSIVIAGFTALGVGLAVLLALVGTTY